MSYDQQILQILMEAGERGISVQAISKHVYNMNSTFFFQPDLEAIKSYVQQYVLRNSKLPQSLVERTEKRGFYRLNTKGSADAREMLLNFKETEKEEHDEQPKAQDLSLSLFD